MPHVIVDPSWPAVLRRHREEAGVSLRQLAPRVLSSRGHLHDLETGRRQPTADLAARLDDALAAGGRLAALVHPVSTPDAGRLAYVADNPSRVDPATVDALGELLALQRRLEDSVGAAAVVPMARAQTDLVTTLVRESRGSIRPQVVAVAAQWAQFGGWLHAATDNPRTARRRYAEAGQWAEEVGDLDMIATVLSMRGHLAWRARRPGPLVELSSAARACPASAGVRALAAQQEARGYALTGRAADVDRLLGIAAEMVETTAGAPSWIYFHSTHYLAMQRGLAHLLLGRHASAVELLVAGLGGLPAESRRAEWAAGYQVHLAEAYRALGERDAARGALAEAAVVAAVTGSAPLSARVAAAVRALDLSTGGRDAGGAHGG